MLETEADRLAIIREAGGELVQVDVTSVLAIFVNAHEPITLGDHVLDSSQPQILGRTSDLSIAHDGSVIVRGTTTYGVAAIEPDGTGMTTIRLREL